MLAQRQLVGYAGAGSDILAILTGGGLFGLALGAYCEPRTTHLRKNLSRTLTIGAALLIPALSVMLIDLIFFGLAYAGIVNRLILAATYTLALLVPSFFCLGRALPLAEKLYRTSSTGRVIGIAAFGAMTGYLISQLVAMPFWGVHGAALIVVLSLLLGILLLRRRITMTSALGPALLALLMIGLNAGALFQASGIFYQNAVNTVRISLAQDGTQLLRLNNVPVAAYNPTTGEAAPYIKKSEDVLLKGLDASTPRSILVLGAGGYAFGRDDTVNHYTYVDTDPDLKAFTETVFTGKPVPANVQTVIEDVRAYLRDARAAGKTFDLVYINFYNGEAWMPETLITQDFFNDVRSVLKPEGIAAANFVINPTFANDYSLQLDATYRSVFPALVTIPVFDVNAWERNPDYMMNVLYVAYNAPLAKSGVINTDERNRAPWSKPLRRDF